METKAKVNANRYDTWRGMVDEWARHHTTWGVESHLELVQVLALIDIAESLRRALPGPYENFPDDVE